MADRNTWQSTTQRKRDALDALLPADFRLDHVPSAEEQRDVTQYIQQFLSANERDITENHSAAALVGQLASGALAATDVTRAFCHRATIAHQLVILRNPRREYMNLMLTFIAGQLSQRGSILAGTGSRAGTRRIPACQWEACWAPPWLADLSERPIPGEGCRDLSGIRRMAGQGRDRGHRVVGGERAEEHGRDCLRQNQRSDQSDGRLICVMQPWRHTTLILAIVY